MKYVFPAIAVIALILGVFGVMPNKMLGGQYNTNHQYFAGITNEGTLTQTGAATVTGAFTLTGDQTVSDDIAVAGSVCAKSGSIYYTLVPSTTNAEYWGWTSSTAPCL